MHLLKMCLLQFQVLPLQLKYINIFCMQLLQPPHELPIPRPLSCVLPQYYHKLLQHLLPCSKL